MFARPTAAPGDKISWFAERIMALDKSLFPVSDNDLPLLLAALRTSCWIPTEPSPVDFLRLLFETLKCDKKKFLEFAVRRILQLTVPILDFFREIDFVLPHHLAKLAIDQTLAAGDVQCAWRLGLTGATEIVLHRAIETVIMKNNIKSAEELMQIAGPNAEVVRKSFDPCIAMSHLSIASRCGRSFLPALQWLIDNRFITSENLNWGMVFNTAAKYKSISLLGFLLDQFFKETPPEMAKILLWIAFEEFDIELLDFLRDRKIISAEMITEIGSPLLGEKRTSYFDPSARKVEESIMKRVELTKKWVDENYPGSLKP